MSRELDAECAAYLAAHGDEMLAELAAAAARCCHKRCAHPPIAGTSRCAKHTGHHRADEGRRRVARRATGLCGVCPRPAVPGKARCAEHDTSLGAYRCGICGERGHNRRTCTAAQREGGR